MPDTSANSSLLSDISPYVYGTTLLGVERIPFHDRVKMARGAMDTGVWFHTSHTYGNALEVLRKAFDRDRAKVPRLIFKIGWESVEELEDVIYQNLEPLGLESMEIGQLCLSGKLAEDFAAGGKSCETFTRLKEEGVVRRYVLEVFPYTSNVALKALRGGCMNGIVDGFIFYFNPLQRFTTNELWDLIVERNEPFIALRTVAGGPVHRLRDVPGAAWRGYIQKRAAEVAPIFERSGIKSWTEFCVRFAFSFPGVRATVGATSRRENLNEFTSAANEVRTLPEDILKEIIGLQYRWSDEFDMHAEADEL